MSDSFPSDARLRMRVKQELDQNSKLQIASITVVEGILFARGEAQLNTIYGPDTLR